MFQPSEEKSMPNEFILNHQGQTNLKTCLKINSYSIKKDIRDFSPRIHTFLMEFFLMGGQDLTLAYKRSCDNQERTQDR